uniref:t-SNARE coiled-coil homology domain-containing protein n=1 Tax=Denticeps clupeoides TaxID=299321 RepID=A0AAY4DP10_9TELE
MADLASKLPLKRLESPIQKFTKVAVPTDLQRLQQHQHNIEKFQRLQQWDRLHQEHVNASRTVQQLRSNLREMEKLCGRVHDDDVEALQKLVQPIREQAVAATRDFLRLHAEAVGQIGPRVAPPTDLLTESSSCSKLIQTQLPVIPPEQNAAESWDSLEEVGKYVYTHTTLHSVNTQSQQEKIDSIEENVSAAAANVEEGARSLGKVRGERLSRRGIDGTPAPCFPRPTSAGADRPAPALDYEITHVRLCNKQKVEDLRLSCCDGSVQHSCLHLLELDDGDISNSPEGPVVA